MIRALRTAATGMMAQQTNIDTVANNLANVNTTGFKRNRVDFQDLMYQTVRQGGAPTAQGQIPAGMQVGLGVRTATTQKLFTQGVLEQTENPLDVAIEGPGFFRITMGDGTIAYTRDGAFKRDAQGNMVTSDGYNIEPGIQIPEEAVQIAIAPDGTVSATIPGNDEPQQLGQIQLSRFANPAGLEAIGRNLFRQTGSSGQPTAANPGSDGLGSLTQGYLEKSNVNVLEEMVNMITAQRAYEINARVIQGADQMLQVVGGLVS